MSRADGQLLTGAQALVESLERSGVEMVFGIPGGAILPTYDPLFDSRIRHILVRREQGGGHTAEGHTIVSGRMGVCTATSGPGTANLVIVTGSAYMDSTPLVAIIGQANGTTVGTDTSQEADIRGIMMPITKHSFLIKETDEIPLAIKEAFHIAAAGRPRPVLVDIARDALVRKVSFHQPEELDLPGYKPTVKPHVHQIRAAAKLISQSRRPILHIGGDIVKAEAFRELATLVEKTWIPVVTTLMARGALPDPRPLHMGIPGMHGTVAAVGALQRADLLIAAGTRSDDRVTNRLDSFTPNTKVIHADINPAEIGENCAADMPIVGDCRQTLALLAKEIVRVPDTDEWLQVLGRMKERYQPRWDETPDGKLSPQEVIQRIGQLSPGDTIYVTEVGQHQVWVTHFPSHERPVRWLTPGGAGAMGFCVPAAMGVKVVQPEKVVWGIDDGGCFQMTNQELVTCALNRIPIKITIINNHALGMVRQWQSLFCNSRYSSTDLHTEHLPNLPMLAETMGYVGLCATDGTKTDECIARALEINDRSVVVKFVVHKDAMIWPMVAAGISNDEIQAARNMTPVWEEEGL